MLLGSALHVPERRSCVFTELIQLTHTAPYPSVDESSTPICTRDKMHDGPVGTEPSRREG